MIARLYFVVVLITLGVLNTAQAADVRLVMFEAEGCTYCEQWNEDIGSFYGGTEEGKWAPLQRVDDDIAWPEELLSIKGVVFTPTFVVTQNNREVGRITGYPGEDYFWGYLVNILKETGFQPD